MTGKASLSDVVDQIKDMVEPAPSSRDQKAEVAWLAQCLVEKEASRHPEIRGVVLSGSFPKDTWLDDDADIDLFIRFERETPRKIFDSVTREVGFAAMTRFGPYERYSEHPFVEATVHDTKVNVVPCFDVERGQWQSAADRTPFHTELMSKKLSDSMRREIRLLKWFLKSNGLYGSEIARRGFSGYVVEVLVLLLGSFESVVRKFAGAAAGMTIGGEPDSFDTPIVIIDPVDERRNLAAAISVENVGRLIMLCRALLNEPSASLFDTPKKRTDQGILGSCIAIRFRYRTRSPDVIWGQLQRAASAIAMQLGRGGFTAIRSGALTDEAGLGVLFFLLESERLGEYRVRRGPDFFSESDSERFLSGNKTRSSLFWIDDDRHICSLERRTIREAEHFLRVQLTDGLATSGIPAGMKEDIAAGFEIVCDVDSLPKPIKASLVESLSTDAALFHSD